MHHYQQNNFRIWSTRKLTRAQRQQLVRLSVPTDRKVLYAIRWGDGTNSWSNLLGLAEEVPFPADATVCVEHDAPVQFHYHCDHGIEYDRDNVLDLLGEGNFYPCLNEKHHTPAGRGEYEDSIRF